MNKNIFTTSLLIAVLFLFNGCSSNYPSLETVKSVDAKKYSGLWYEIARLPFSIQEGCSCTTAEYQIINEVEFSVVNKCLKEGEWDVAEGKAFVVENSNNSKLLVQFFWPFKGDYWIIDLDEQNYSYAVVGTPSRKYMWILSRTKKLNDTILANILRTAAAKGFDTTKLIFTDQTCN